MYLYVWLLFRPNTPVVMLFIYQHVVIYTIINIDSRVVWCKK